MNQERWQAFYDSALHNGELIELVIREVYGSALGKDAVALDGGANVGYHTLKLASHLTQGMVIAVEANPTTLATLEKAAGPLANVRVVHAALQDDPERNSIEFNCSSSHPGRSGVGRLWDRLSPGEVKYDPPAAVPATTIDRMVLEHDLRRMDFIKLDLEGGEYRAVRGAEQTLRRLRPLIVTEHSHKAPELNGFIIEEYLDWLSHIGYVPVSPSGAVVTRAKPFPFWYIFLVPEERLQQSQECIVAALERHG